MNGWSRASRERRLDSLISENLHGSWDRDPRLLCYSADARVCAEEVALRAEIEATNGLLVFITGQQPRDSLVCHTSAMQRRTDDLSYLRSHLEVTRRALHAELMLLESKHLVVGGACSAGVYKHICDFHGLLQVQIHDERVLRSFRIPGTRFVDFHPIRAGETVVRIRAAAGGDSLLRFIVSYNAFTATTALRSTLQELVKAEAQLRLLKGHHLSPSRAKWEGEGEGEELFALRKTLSCVQCEQEKFEAKRTNMRRALSLWRSRRLGAAFGGWVTHHHRLQYLRQARAKALRAWRNACTGPAFRGWLARHRRAVQSKAMLLRVYMRWKNAALGRALGGWRARCLLFARMRRVQARVLCGWRNRLLGSAFKGWLAKTHRRQNLQRISAEVDAFILGNTFAAWRDFVDTSQKEQYRREHEARLNYMESLESEIASTESEVRRLAAVATDLSSRLETKTWCPIYDVSMNSFDVSIEIDEPEQDMPNGMPYEERQVWGMEANLNTARNLLGQFQGRIDFLTVQLAASQAEPSYF